MPSGMNLLELGEELRVLRASNDKDSDADADGANTRQKQKIGAWVAATTGASKHVTETDRPALELHCAVKANELAQVKELTRACDAASCHNANDVVIDELGRPLNAERVKSLGLSTPKMHRCQVERAQGEAVRTIQGHVGGGRFTHLLPRCPRRQRQRGTLGIREENQSNYVGERWCGTCGKGLGGLDYMPDLKQRACSPESPSQ
jgi:hypothetical protein